jgi:putative cell wall-binding protein
MISSRESTKKGDDAMTSHKFRKTMVTILILILLASFPISSAYGQVEDWTAEMTRFGGADRYETSAMISAYLLDTSEYVVIARGDTRGNYADALAGSYLAGFRSAPLLLSSPTALPVAVRDEIIRLGATKAYILGGTGAISQAVEDTLKGMGLEIVRLSGSRREETAVAIVDYVRSNQTMGAQEVDDFVFLVNGTATADALVAGSYSYKYGIPILLVNVNSLPASTGNALSEYDFDFVDLVGGKAVISESLEALLNTNYGVRQRISGPNRYVTSIVFAETMFPGAEHYAFIAGRNANLADGISAAAFGFPILYVYNDSAPSELVDYLNTYLSAFSHLIILGGTNAITENVTTLLTGIQEALPPMITYAYIENEAGDYKVYAAIDNVNNTITLDIDGGHAHDQFITGFSNLSKDVYVVISNTHNGAYDIPTPGRLVATDDDFVEIILDLWDDNPPAGVNAQTLLANSGAIFTLTAANDSSNSRTYTFHVNTYDI